MQNIHINQVINLNWDRASVLPLHSLKCETFFFLFTIHSVGYASFIQESRAEQHKGRTAVLHVLIAAHIKLRNPERKENKQNAPFLRAIKQSVVKSARQRSAVKERSAGYQKQSACSVSMKMD